MPRMMTVLVLRSDGTEEEHEVQRNDYINQIHRLLGCTIFDTVNLTDENGRLDGRVMLVDDIGHQKGLPVNWAATTLYHARCRPGSQPPPIVGDVAIVWENEGEAFE